MGTVIVEEYEVASLPWACGQKQAVVPVSHPRPTTAHQWLSSLALVLCLLVKAPCCLHCLGSHGASAGQAALPCPPCPALGMQHSPCRQVLFTQGLARSQLAC